MPTVSVVLNCYNHEDYVAEAIESVLAQSFTDFELLITDNGSTDGTRKVIQSFKDPRIRLMLHDANESLSRRLNQAAAAAKGEYVCVLYSDDMMLSDKLERQVALFEKQPADVGVVYCPALRFNHYTGEIWPYPSMRLSGDLMPAILDHFFDGPPDMSSPLVRRACLAEHHWHEDLFSDGEGIFLRIALDWKFHFDSAPTVKLRDHASNMGKAVQRNHDMFMTMCERLEREPLFSPQYMPNLNRLRAVISRNSAWTALRVDTDDRAWVGRQLRAVLKFDWHSALHPRYIAGLVLASVPTGARRALNGLGRRIRGTRENVALVTEY